jgi:hypothetical protein
MIGLKCTAILRGFKDLSFESAFEIWYLNVEDFAVTYYLIVMIKFFCQRSFHLQSMFIKTRFMNSLLKRRFNFWTLRNAIRGCFAT